MNKHHSKDELLGRLHPKPKRTIWRIATFILVASFLAACGNEEVAPGVPKSAADRIEALIKAKLKDPNSLLVDWVPYDPTKTAYCSTYNAKNSFGGYAGRHRFAAFAIPENGKIKTVTGVVLEDTLSAGNPATDVVCH